MIGYIAERFEGGSMRLQSNNDALVDHLTELFHKIEKPWFGLIVLNYRLYGFQGSDLCLTQHQ